MNGNELMHYGVLGMKWGRRKAAVTSGGLGRRRAKAPPSSTPSRIQYKSSRRVNTNRSQAWDKIKERGKQIAKSKTAQELMSRGKSAIDVLMNGDKDWMGNSISNGSGMKEAQNRGKAALERLMYSAEQVENKKFYGKYNPFG